MVGAPAYSIRFMPISMPAMCDSGAAASSTSAAWMPLVCTVTAVLYSALRWVSMAPLGRPVMPDV